MTVEFVITSLIVIVMPGTGVLYTLAAALARGGRASIIAAFGCTLGILPHIAAAVLGLAALMHTSAVAFQAAKYAGIAYLLYMAWSALRAGGVLRVNSQLDAGSALQLVVTGFLINILNPKLSIFFLAFLPQFVGPDEASPLARMLSLSATFMAMTFVVFVFYGLAAAAVRARVLSRPTVLAWLRRSFAAAFLALGLRLAFAER